jgi:hypothetical protein
LVAKVLLLDAARRVGLEDVEKALTDNIEAANRTA